MDGGFTERRGPQGEGGGASGREGGAFGPLRLHTPPPGTDRWNPSGGGGGAADVGRDQGRPRQMTGAEGTQLPGRHQCSETPASPGVTGHPLFLGSQAIPCSWRAATPLFSDASGEMPECVPQPGLQPGAAEAISTDGAPDLAWLAPRGVIGGRGDVRAEVVLGASAFSPSIALATSRVRSRGPGGETSTAWIRDLPPKGVTRAGSWEEARKRSDVPRSGGRGQVGRGQTGRGRAGRGQAAEVRFTT